jgi:transposase InsO family protein
MGTRLKVENRSLFDGAEPIEALRDIVDSRLVYYNERRRHPSLQNAPPVEYLQQHFTQ